MPSTADHPAPLRSAVRQAIQQAGGWLSFDRFMSLALYAPEGGYYAGGLPKFGAMPASGSDFVTAPELSPLFGRSLAMQVAQALHATDTLDVWEFGAGTGALARQVLDALVADGRFDRVRYHIVELSGSLRERQRAHLMAHAGRVVWAERWPDELHGVVLGNEVLDAMPVQLLHRIGGQWHERGVVLAAGADPHADAAPWAWQDRPTDLRPPLEPEGPADYLTEIHPQAEAFVRSLSQRLRRGAAFLIDYGFPEREYYHPQRHMGTLMCHQGHRADGNPLLDVGAKDITAHVNFTGIALAAQDAGQQVLGYTSQARFLINCGLVDLASAASVAERAQAMKLVHEHEMGELFKVLAFAPEASAGGWDPLGFAQGDRTHTL